MLASFELASEHDIIGAKEKQAAAKQTFVFLAPLTSKRSAEQTMERWKRGLASEHDIMSAREPEGACSLLVNGECRSQAQLVI